MSGIEVPFEREHIRSLSSGPGVYMLKNAADEVLYVGKAKSLRDRVRNYLGRDASRDVKTAHLVRQTTKVETLVLGTDIEALILEANLIKSHQPRFNIQLKDDKRYPYIKVTVKEPFPRVYVTRKTDADGSRYFGPYTSVRNVRQALQVINRLHTVRSCRYDLPKDAPSRPCLDYHIGRCLAPCVGLQSEEDYRGMIDEIVGILEGNSDEVRQSVELRMKEAADRLDFEQAARHRDVLNGLDVLARQQRVHRFGGGDLDALGVARDGSLGVGVTMRIRSGALLGRDTQRFSDLTDERDADLLTSFAIRYYLSSGRRRSEDLPREVLCPEDFADRELLEQALTDAAGRKVLIRIPSRGEKLRLTKLAAENARGALEDRVLQLDDALDRADRSLYDLQKRLGLKVVPRLMMCFDISHLQGVDTVASAVVFENGEPKKSEYRRMKIKGDWGNDDYRSMQEAITRALRRRIDEDLPLPDLLLIDGGKGQLGAGLEAINALGLDHIHLAALAKKEEEVFLPDRLEPVRIGRSNRALHVLQRIRNEAHRFAVTYNRKLRRARTIQSELAGIPGVGPKKQRLLLERFGSVRSIRAATAEELTRVPGVSDVLASRIQAYLAKG